MRVVLHRDNGKLVWLNLRDATSESFQVAVSKRDCDEAGFAAAKLLDNADLVIATGPLTKTKTGEVTVWASSLRMASKSLVPPPEKWAGLQDVESRYRKRYVDLWANPDAMRVLSWMLVTSPIEEMFPTTFEDVTDNSDQRDVTNANKNE